MKKIVLFVILFTFVFAICSVKNVYADLEKERIETIKITEEQIINEVLKSLDLSFWLDNPPLDYHILSGDIYPDNGEELIVAISMGKDNGILAVFTQNKSEYRLIEVRKDFVPITDLKIINLPGSATKALLVEEYLDELLGAFHEEKSWSIYLFKEQSLQRVWKEIIYSRQIRPSGNKTSLFPEIPWSMKIKNTNIFFTQTGQLMVCGTEMIFENINKEYEQISAEPFYQLYNWNINEKIFEIMKKE